MIIENIKHTRSHRKFTEKSIKEEEILEMLEGARFSASTKNTQILRYSYTIDDKKSQLQILKKIFCNWLSFSVKFTYTKIYRKD